MRIVVQRVKESRVLVEGDLVGEIGKGLLLLVGIGLEDTDSVLDPMAQKVINLRIFPDDEGKMNRSLLEAGGEILAVSQFTLYADCRKGRRPNFLKAAAHEIGAKLFDQFVESLRSTGIRVATGRFGAMMDVQLINAGPVTIWLDSEELGLTKPDFKTG